MLTTRPETHCYIGGAGVISPQKTYDNGEFLPAITSYQDNVLNCMLPNFKDYINPFQMRRLSRVLRMGLTAATICLREAAPITPDAVITATGHGFQDDMAKFLSEILQQNEEQLTPTYFMQSTYNALAGLIALSFKCTGYNNTYVSRGFAFENALHDAMMLLEEKEAAHILVGSFDETSPVQYSAYERMGYLKQEKINSLNLFAAQTPGTLQGEGVAFFMLSATPGPRDWCRLTDIRTLYKPDDYRNLADALGDFLTLNNKRPDDIDVFINGISGDILRDQWNMSIRRDYFGQHVEVRFKHLTGEYATASSFALWLGAMILKNQVMPRIVQAGPVQELQQIETVLICNHFFARNYTFMLLEKGSSHTHSSR